MGNATQVQFRLLENSQTKQKFFGAFTDIDEMNKWNGVSGSHKVVTDFDSLAGMVMDPQSGTEGFVINAFGKSVTFPKPMVISIKQQYDYMRREKNVIENGAQVRIGEPKEYPIDLMAALINHLNTEPQVNAAYLRMIEKDGKIGYFIVVDFLGDMDSTFEGIADASKPFIDDEEALTLMPFTMDFARNAVMSYLVSAMKSSGCSTPCRSAGCPTMTEPFFTATQDGRNAGSLSRPHCLNRTGFHIPFSSI